MCIKTYSPHFMNRNTQCYCLLVAGRTPRCLTCSAADADSSACWICTGVAGTAVGCTASNAAVPPSFTAAATSSCCCCCCSCCCCSRWYASRVPTGMGGSLGGGGDGLGLSGWSSSDPIALDTRNRSMPSLSAVWNNVNALHIATDRHTMLMIGTHCTSYRKAVKSGKFPIWPELLLIFKYHT